VGTLFVNATELERFIEARAIVLPEPFNGETCALEPLEPLRRRLRSAGLVMLGETNHFIHEKSDFRLLLSRVLMSEGWSCFLEELGHSDGIRVNRFLQSGDERELEHLPSFGYTAHLRSDRDDRPGGILKSESYPTEAFLWEQKRFYSGLRSEVLRKGGEVHLAGIDIDGLPGGSYEDIADLIPAMATKLHPFLQALRRVPNESAGDEANRLRTALRLLPEDWPHEIADSVRALSESLEYIAMTYCAQSYDAVRPGMAFRESAMKRRFQAAKANFAEARLVLMAHALHLAKNDAAIKAGGVGPGGGQTSSLGHWLTQEGKEVAFSVWMLYGAGEDSQPLANLPRQANFPTHSLNAMLARQGKGLLFFPADAPELFRPPCVVGHMYNALFETSLLEQTDAVVFLPKVTPLRRA
jgi:erythromycin esterase-like protein